MTGRGLKGVGAAGNGRTSVPRLPLAGRRNPSLASVHPETLSFWNRWLIAYLWEEMPRRLGLSCGSTPLKPETTLTAGADNASGTHHPGHYIRSVCTARDRLRTKGDVAMAGRPAPADQPGCGGSAATGGG